MPTKNINAIMPPQLIKVIKVTVNMAKITIAVKSYRLNFHHLSPFHILQDIGLVIENTADEHNATKVTSFGVFIHVA